MLKAFFNGWGIIAWLAGLLLIAVIDAIKGLCRGGGAMDEFNSKSAGRRAFAGEVTVMQSLFDKSEDEDLQPESRPAVAFSKREMAVLREWRELCDKSA